MSSPPGMPVLTQALGWRPRRRWSTYGASFTTSQLKELLGADCRFLFSKPDQLAVPPQSPQGGGSNYLTLAHRNASQLTRPNHLRRPRPSPTPLSGLSPSSPSRASVLWPSPHEEEFVSAFKARIEGSGKRTTRSGVAWRSQLPLSLPAELEPNNRSALLEPCAASASAASAAAARAPRRIR